MNSSPFMTGMFQSTRISSTSGCRRSCSRPSRPSAAWATSMFSSFRIVPMVARTVRESSMTSARIVSHPRGSFQPDPDHLVAIAQSKQLARREPRCDTAGRDLADVDLALAQALLQLGRHEIGEAGGGG